MKIKFVYRIDDIHPAMMWSRFWQIMELMKKHNVVPLLGIIPDNQDDSLNFDRPNPAFDSLIRKMVAEGTVEIAQHGYQHLYSTQQRSFNQVLYGRVSASEFVGLPYQEQYEKIGKGKALMESRGLFTKVWMAPSHTNDRNTYRALKELGFQCVTDGTALYPYCRYDIVFVPQQIWRPEKEMPFGVYTIALHLNDLEDETIEELEAHFMSSDEIIPFSKTACMKREWYYAGADWLYKLKRIAYHRCIRPWRNLKISRGLDDTRIDTGLYLNSFSVKEDCSKFDDSSEK